MYHMLRLPVMLAAALLTIAGGRHAALADRAEPTGALSVVSDGELVAAVEALPDEVLENEPGSPTAEKLLQAYYDSIRDWGEIVRGRFQPVPGSSGCGYYGRGGHNEDDVRPIAYAAMVGAFLAEVEPPGNALSEADRARMRDEAIAALRYLTQSHVTGGGACLDGKPWGDQWQSAMWARAAGMAGWILWPRLDPPLRRSVARLVEHEADRFLAAEPKSREFRDTGAEENAWNSQIVALAANMMPRHPRAAPWDEAARRYMYNTLSVASDHEDPTPGDSRRPIRDWVTTVNAHADYTVENHGLVHVGYLKTAVAMLMESAGHYALRRRPAPRASLHHVPEALEIVYGCAAWDGSPIFFGGNDWKIFHSQATDVVMYATASLLADDARAARLERAAVDWLRRMQLAEEGYYNVRRDLEYGGLCATRQIACYLAHAVLGEGAEPLSEEEFDRRASGVRHLEFGRAIVHRTPTKFASFSWGPKRMALAVPRDGNWVVWPHFASYLGIIDGQDPSARTAELARFTHEVGDNWFTVAGTLKRCDGRLVQDFAFASPAGDVTVYVERLTAAEGFRVAGRETGVVGHEYALGSNARRLYGPFGSIQIEALGGEPRVHELAGDWLNLGDRVGYVVRRAGRRENLMRYHDFARGTGRVPKLQEWLSLIGDRDGSPLESPDWACVVTLLNQPSRATAEWAPRVRFEIDGERATCRVGRDEVRIDFASPGCRIVEGAE